MENEKKYETNGDELAAKVKQLELQVQNKEKEYLYLYAELDNVRKRFARERNEIYQYCWEPIASDLLDVVDSLERALNFADKTGDTNLAEGIKLTLTQLQGTLKKHGVRRLQTLGESFDPRLHEATASMVPTAGQAKDIVLIEETPGYILHERLLRPARVVISSGEKKTA